MDPNAMDPITTAIIAALSLGGLSGISSVAHQAVVDSYNALKNLLKEKYGAESDLVKAVDSLETKPTEGRKIIVYEEIQESNANADTAILEMAKKLLVIIEGIQLPPSEDKGVIIKVVKEALVKIDDLLVERGSGVVVQDSEKVDLHIGRMEVGSGKVKSNRPKAKRR